MRTGVQPLYFARRAGEAMVRRPRVAVTVTLTVAVAALVAGLFAGALQGARRLAQAWAGEVRISVYLDPGADLATARAAAQALAPGREVEAVDAAEALRRFRAALGPEGALLDGAGPDVVPPSLEVRATGLSLAGARQLAAGLARIPGAQDVDYGEAWLSRLESLVRRGERLGLALLAALVLGAAVLVSNTLRLGVFARRDEIDIMRLVGATDRFVALPFLIEGVAEGLLGGALAAAALSAAATAVAPRVGAALALAEPLRRADLLPAGLVAALAGGGALLGLAASVLAVRRELRGRG